MGGSSSKPAAESAPPDPSSPAADRSAKMSPVTTEPAVEKKRKLRFLLIGAGGVGKSTIFKQMKLLYVNKGSFTAEQKQGARTQIRENLLESLCDLARFCCEHSEEIPDVSLVVDGNDDLLDNVDAVSEVVGEQVCQRALRNDSSWRIDSL